MRTHDSAADKENWMADLEMLLLWSRQGGRRFRVDEVRLAYDLLLDRRLSRPDGQTLEPYRMMDINTVSDVMTAFERYRRTDADYLEVLRTQALEAEAAPPDGEKALNALLFQYQQDARRGEWVTDTGNVIYDWLTAEGWLVLTPSQKWEYYRQAAEAMPELMKQKQSDARSVSDEARKRTTQAIRDVINGIENEYAKRWIVAYAKDLALNDYLNEALHESLS